MLFHSASIALNGAALINVIILVACAVFAVSVLRHWDLGALDERQLRMERRTYLVSTVLALVFTTELASLLLFVFAADKMAVMFVGAMCAVGTLNVNAFGFPALMVKIVLFFGAGLWLVLNAVDNRGYDYPLIRAKYALLIALVPLAVAALVLQYRFFADMRADVLTSCCSKIFTRDAGGVSASLATAPPLPAMAVSGGLVLLAVAVAAHGWVRGGGLAYQAYALLAPVVFVAAIAAVIAAIAPYVYEQPHHNCPFCLLKGEYGYVGYLLYAPLFAGTVLGIGVGPIQLWRDRESLRDILPGLSRRLTAVSAACYLLFGLTAAVLVATSGLRMI